MADTAATMDIYDGDKLITTVPIVNGAWSAQLAGLQVGPHGFTARTGQVTSDNKWEVGVYPSVQLTDFQDGSWGRWAKNEHFVRYTIANSGGNSYGSLSIVEDMAGVWLLNQTVSGLTPMNWYSLKCKAQCPPALYFNMSAEGAELQIWNPSAEWTEYELVFQATSASVVCGLFMQGVRSGATVNLDDIQIAMAPPPESAS